MRGTIDRKAKAMDLTPQDTSLTQINTQNQLKQHTSKETTVTNGWH